MIQLHSNPSFQPASQALRGVCINKNVESVRTFASQFAQHCDAALGVNMMRIDLRSYALALVKILLQYAVIIFCSISVPAWQFWHYNNNLVPHAGMMLFEKPRQPVVQLDLPHIVS